MAIGHDEQQGMERRLWNGRWEMLMRARVVDDTVAQGLQQDGFGPVAARVAAARLGVQARHLAAPPLSAMQHYRDLPDIERAAQRVVDAIRNDESIALYVDYDADGCTSGAILMEALVGLFGVRPERVTLLMGHRLKDGYGLTDAAVDQVLGLDCAPQLLITADCGSADEARIARLLTRSVQTIVLDHHEIPADRPPSSAYAFVSPKREGARYDRNIAGCMVAFLLMAAVRNILIAASSLREQTCKLNGLLEYAALGSLADCVDIGASATNRAVIRSGMRRMNQGSRACWRVASRSLGQETMRLTSKDYIFGLVPRINAHSRLSDAMPGYRFLSADNEAEAMRLFTMLSEANEERKTVERRMAEKAVEIAQRQVDAGRRTLVVWLEDGHPGVQGIVASRLVERFARPAVCLSPHRAQGDVASGSLRSVPGYSISRGLDWIRTREDVLIAGGGHDMAGGVTLQRSALERFSELFEESAHGSLEGARLQSVVEHDGVLSCSDITAKLIDELASIEPYGQGFPRPIFLVEGAVAESVRTIGKDEVHLKLQLRQGLARTDGVWFFARKDRESPLPIAEGRRFDFLVEADTNWYRGEARVQARVIGVVVAS